MKKNILVLFLALSFLFIFSACVENKNTGEEDTAVDPGIQNKSGYNLSGDSSSTTAPTATQPDTTKAPQTTQTPSTTKPTENPSYDTKDSSNKNHTPKTGIE